MWWNVPGHLEGWTLRKVSKIPGTGVFEGPTQSQRSQSFLKPLCRTEDECEL